MPGSHLVDDWQVPPHEARSLVPHSDLAARFFDHTGSEIHKWTHYLAAYEEQFGPLRAGMAQPDGTRRPVRFLEIGVAHGGALQLWRSYFGPEAAIWGIDVDERCANLPGDVTIRIGSQADPSFLASVVADMGGIDVVVDDGSHIGADQRASFATLFPQLSDGGLYVVEDLHTSYWTSHEGGYRRPGTFMETAKAILDDMHAWYHDRGDSEGVSAACTIPRMTFYDSMVCIAKARRPRPTVTRIGAIAL